MNRSFATSKFQQKSDFFFYKSEVRHDIAMAYNSLKCPQSPL